MKNNAQTHNKALFDMLIKLGIEAEPDDEWLRLPGGKRMRAMVSDHDTQTPEVSMVRLDVVMQLWIGRYVVESCAGYGPSREAATSHAVESFAKSAAKPLLVAFLHTDHEVIRDAWEIDGAYRAVTVGDISTRGKASSKSNTGWFEAFKRSIQNARLTTGAHWVRLYYAQQDNRTVAMEVLLDNEPWEEVRESMHNIPFPKGDGFFSARVFLVIQGGVDVSRATARMIELPARPDAEVAELLATDGANPQEIKALLAFIPLAFGRVALEPLPIKFSDTATLRKSPEQGDQTIRLGDETIYAEAKAQADRAVPQGRMTQDQFLAVALRSAEVHAINNALQGGAKAEDLVVSAPTITLF